MTLLPITREQALTGWYRANDMINRCDTIKELNKCHKYIEAAWKQLNRHNEAYGEMLRSKYYEKRYKIIAKSKCG